MIVILTHENTDFDAIAAQLGAWKLHPNALPVVPRHPNRNVRDFLTLYWDELPFVRLEDLSRRPIEEVILVDTQAISPIKGMGPSTPIRIIDHHPLAQELNGRVQAHIEEVGATTTIFVEQIAGASIPVTPIEATLLLLGIYEDTGNLTYGTTTSRDLRAAAWLLDRGANLTVVNDFMQYPLSPEQRELYNRLVQEAEPYQFAGHTVIISMARAGARVEEVSTLAHKLRDLFDPDALFILVQMNEHIQMVARSSTDDIDVGRIAANFEGGGHGRAAAAVIRGLSLREVRDRLLELLERYVQPATTVGEIMSFGVHTLDASATVAEAAALMSRLGHEGFPVVENGRVVGVLTRREIDRAMQLKLGDAPVSLYMTPGAIQVTPESSVEELQRIMMEYGVGQVPVVKDGRPIGIVTRTDLIKLWSAPRRRPPQAQDLAQRLSQALPPKLEEILRLAGQLADEMGYSLYVVGGFVRDLLLGIPNLDLDLVVEGDAIKLARRLAERIGGRVRSHARFGTAKWLPDPNDPELKDIGTLDFATARVEFYEHPTALPQVERSSIRQDLHRRDFTINTLAICLNGERYGELLDFFGGQSDLRRKLIRVLHSLSFVEDPTRMLRAVRLEQRLGFRIEPRTEQLMRNAQDLLTRTTPERIRHELYLILAEVEPERALRRLDELGLLSRVHPALTVDDWFMEMAGRLRQELKRFSPLPEHPEGNSRLFHVEKYRPEGLYLALLLYRSPRQDVESFLESLRIMRGEAMLVRQVLALREVLPQLDAPRLKRSEIYALLEPFDEPALFIGYVVQDSWLVRQRIELFLRRLRDIKPLADGRALKELGIKPGPVYRQILERLRAAWMDGEITDAAGERALLERLVAELSAGAPNANRTTDSQTSSTKEEQIS
jgi:tRNA nucleotidyltransferase (CCA-adding enzyme)